MLQAGDKVHWTKYGRSSIRRVEGIIVSVENDVACVRKKNGMNMYCHVSILHKHNESGEMDVIVRAMR